MKRITLLCLALVLLTACAARGGSGSEAVPSPAVQRSEEQPKTTEIAAGPDEKMKTPAAPPLPEQETMMATIQALCRAPRPIGSAEEYKAAQFLQGRLQEYGYESELKPFAYNISRNTIGDRYRQARELTGEAFFAAAQPGEFPDGESRNIVGRQPRESEKERILILSAHYDSTADSIGVIDNATGVAVVLEAARILAKEDLPFALRIVFFGGEEEILIGSRQYLLGMSPEETGRILGNINVDTLAYTKQEEFAVLTPFTLPQQDAATLSEFSPVAAALLTDSRVTPEYSSRFVGDHMAFAAAGIDSVNFGQSMTAVTGVINSPADTYERLVPELLPTAAQMLADAVRELAKRSV